MTAQEVNHATSAAGKPLTARGERTRRAILDAAEVVFAEFGWESASIVKITEHAGVAHGSFYRYFDSKHAIFDEVVDRFNRRVRRAMSQAASLGATRIERERLGFEAYFRFAEQHPRIYTVIRQAEFASPGSYRRHYERIATGYIENLSQGVAEGELFATDVEVVAYALMAIGEMIGQRWILWGDGRVPDEVFDQMMALIERGLLNANDT